MQRALTRRFVEHKGGGLPFTVYISQGRLTIAQGKLVPSKPHLFTSMILNIYLNKYK